MHTFNYFPAIIRYMEGKTLSLVFSADDITAGKAFKIIACRVRKVKQ